MLCCFLVATANADTVNVRFADPQINGNQYSVTVQVSAEEDDLNIGSATIFFSYNKNAITNPVAQGSHFSENHICDGNSTATYETSFTRLEVEDKGDGNYAILMGSPNSGCPAVTTEWIDVATYTFQLLDANAPLEMEINGNYTAFNTVANDGTLHEQGALLGYTDISASESVVTSVTSIDNPSGRLEVFPIPAKDLVNITYNALSSSDATIVVYDILGKEIITNTQAFNKGANNIKFDLVEFESGTYFVKIGHEGLSITKPFLVVK